MLITTPVVWSVGRVVGISITGNIHLATSGTLVCLLLPLMFLCVSCRSFTLGMVITSLRWHHYAMLSSSSTTSPTLGSSLLPSSTTSWVTTEGGYRTIYLVIQQPVVRAAAAAAAAAAAHCPTYRLLGEPLAAEVPEVRE